MTATPNPEFLRTLLDLGISEPTAKEALLQTANTSVEAAVQYVFGDADTDIPESVRDGEEFEPKFCKMVFVVNTSLNMGIGKIAAQVAHACLGLYRAMVGDDAWKTLLNEWEHYGEKKIVLKARDHFHLLELQKKAEEMSIPAYLVHDAGHTQIPADSMTVLSLFAEEERVDSITGELKLL